MVNNEYIQVQTTFPDAAGAKQFAREIVVKQYAACVQIVPVASIFSWKGSLEEAEEVLLIIKTTTGMVEVIESLLASIHPYEVPEFWVIGPCRGSRQYLNWMNGSISTW